MSPAIAVPLWAVLAVALGGLAAAVPIAALAAGELRPPRVVPRGAMVAAGAATAVLAVLVTIRFGVSPLLLPYLLLAPGSVLLALVDALDRRLPNRLISLVGMLFLVLLLVAAALTGRLVPFAWGALGALALLLTYLVLAPPFREAIGMGDVKLAAVLGLACGFLGLRSWLVALVAPFVVNALVVLVALALRRTTLRSSFPFGPAMVAGLWIAVLTA